MSEFKTRKWTQGPYYISTDSDLIPVKAVNKAFEGPAMYWANPLPEDALRTALTNSLCFGVFDERLSGDDALVGLARCLTDYTTFLYLDDVHIWPAHQGQGLGKWLVTCVLEVVESMPHLRASMLLTGSWMQSVPFYEKFMKMRVMDTQKDKGIAVMILEGPGNPRTIGKTLT